MNKVYDLSEIMKEASENIAKLTIENYKLKEKINRVLSLLDKVDEDNSIIGNEVIRNILKEGDSNE